MKRYTLMLLFLAVACLFNAAPTLAATPLKVLIVDGQNNHNWAGTTPVIKQILEDSGKFTVDVATSPKKKQPMDSFQPAFSKYDVVFSNYNGDNWPQSTQTALETYMKNGGGLVIFHAADNAFSNWDEWNKMIGLGGWGGRNEKSGPMIRYRDGKVIRDTSPGAGGTHGPQHPFQIVRRNSTHPIMQGLPAKWMHVSDELYSKLRGPAENLTLLATAYADPAKRGTGENEPMLFTMAYGQGRVFHNALGHGPDQLKCVCCIALLQRGTEWAATGKVTLPVPEDFPTADQISIRESLSANYKAIESYDFGTSREALANIEAEIRSMPKNMVPKIEAQLIKALTDSDSSAAAKQFCCRMLRRVGSAQSVPALAKLLPDPELSHMARFALQLMPAPEAGAALRQAVTELDGDLRTGVIGTLGLRGERKAVAILKPLASANDRQTAQAAIKALGRLGGTQSAKALHAATVLRALRTERDDALLMCADSLAANDKTKQAMKIYQSLSQPAYSTWIRIAAYQGLVKADPEQAGTIILGLLRDKNLHMQRAAGKFIAQIPGEAMTESLAKQLPTLDPEAQVLLLSALETRQDKTASPFVQKAASSDNAEVQMAALKALGTLGSSEHVAFLAAASMKNDAQGKTAQDSLKRITGPGVTEALIQQSQSDSPASLRGSVIDVLIARREMNAGSALCQVAKDSNVQVRRAAYRGLGALASAQEVPAMVSLLLSAKSASDRSALERALVSVVSRDETADAAPILKGLSQADNAVKTNLLAVLPVIGSDEALAAVRSVLKTQDVDLRKNAIRVLSKWPNGKPLDSLLGVARNESDSVQQILALRGYIQLLNVPTNSRTAETVECLTQALAVAKRTDEKQLILAALPKYPCDAALALAKRLQQDPALKREADMAITKIKQLMLNLNKSVTASRSSNNAKRAIDGKIGTRWSTDRAMKPGDWFVVDLGMEATVGGLTLDTKNSANDYPRGYEVYVSFDGGNWGDPILKGKGTNPITKIRFPKPVNTRFIKITQTGSSDSWNWSIHEMSVDQD
ncbi:MAG: HEAT repeat domain-containing protein [Phycisphaeraceae bacterium]|nr:HEAT repeat domain-containing protein [Phycisphaeraceae bacterium]